MEELRVGVSIMMIFLDVVFSSLPSYIIIIFFLSTENGLGIPHRLPSCHAPEVLLIVLCGCQSQEHSPLLVKKTAVDPGCKA